jgi:hypothetical protein
MDLREVVISASVRIWFYSIELVEIRCGECSEFRAAWANFGHPAAGREIILLAEKLLSCRIDPFVWLK